MALARALAISPRALARRAFGALDALVRTELRQWVKSSIDRSSDTILVTHDQDEAMEWPTNC